MLKGRAVPGWGLPAVITAVQLGRLAQALRLPDGRLTSFLYDDAFYYLVLARNFARLGRWTFDGVEPASGFHLLWGYLLAGLYWLRPGLGLHGVVLVGGLAQTACLAGAAWLARRTAVRLAGEAAEAGVWVMFLATLTLKVGLGMMEAGVVVVVAAATVELLCRAEGADWQVCGALGLVGMMARSDAGLLAACLLGMQCVLWGRGMTSRAMVRVAAACFVGAVLGGVVVTAHTHWVSGAWVQASAREKLFWAELKGFSAAPMRHLLLQLLDPGYYWGVGARAGAGFARVVAVLLGVGAVMKMRAWRGGMLGGMAGAVAGYLCLYRYNSGETQEWYVANFLVPLAVLSGAGVAWWWERARVGTAVCVGVVCAAGVAAGFQPVARENAGLYTAGMYLRAHPELRPVGSWNAGAISYFGGGGVTNLDGLVNDRVYAYARADALLEYVRGRGLRTLIDYPVMMEPEVMRAYGEGTMMRRGGYSDGRLLGCVMGERLEGGAVVWRVKAECLR